MKTKYLFPFVAFASLIFGLSTASAAKSVAQFPVEQSAQTFGGVRIIISSGNGYYHDRSYHRDYNYRGSYRRAPRRDRGCHYERPRQDYHYQNCRPRRDYSYREHYRNRRCR